MNKKQKIILIIFGIFDIAIVTLLAGTIVKTWSTYSATINQSPASSCADFYLDALQDNNHQITFSMENDVIYTTILIHAGQDQDTLDDTQLLWALLNHLGPVAARTTELCLNPRLLTVQVNITYETVTINHLALIPIQDLISWSQGTISENDFAANIKYRQFTLARD